MTCHRGLLIVALACHAVPAGGQTRIALSGGLVSAAFEEEIGGVATDAVDNRAGIAFGLAVRRSIGPRLAIAPELLLVAKGGSESGGEAALRFRYLEIPVLVRYDLPAPTELTPWLAAGPVVGWMVSCTLSDGDTFSESCDDAYGPDQSYSRFDFGMTMAVGIRMRRIGVSVRREVGFRDIDEADGFAARNRAWLALVQVDL